MAIDPYSYLASFEILSNDFLRLAESVEPADANLQLS